MKRCSMCKETKPLDAFSKRTMPASVGYQPNCKDCMREYQRQWRKRNTEKSRAWSRRYSQENREKARAHLRVHEAVKRGDLVVPEECERCGRQATLDGHHADYSKPLKVEWLCRTCHFAQHNRLGHSNLRRGEVLTDESYRGRQMGPEYEVDEASGCWLWRRAITTEGYGGSGDGKLAHRVFYERHIGAIPEGLQVTHTCENRTCVNPAHLEAITFREVQRRRAQEDLAKRRAA